jgi:hypothetical protein
MRRSILARHLASIGLVLLTTGSVAHAQSQNQNGQAQTPNGQGQNQGGGGGQGPRLSATPELDSAVLFSVGVIGLGAASSVLRRLRQRRNPDR